MKKNIVICCDGTGNEYGPKNTNVVKLFSALERNPKKQKLFYDPGVGTFDVHPALNKISKGWMRMLGLAFGLGITQNIRDGYTYLMKNYQEGDRVYIFGFSRGAYTARALAALLYKCGLLHKDNENLLSYALKMFKRQFRYEIWSGFKNTFARPCPVHFLGLWDTVSSLGWVWDPVTFPYTTNNPEVAVIRHAISIDERRAFFRQNLCGVQYPQDIKQVWFAGVHSDVGGSYLETESGLAQIALEWMLVEAGAFDLIIDKAAAKKILNEPVSPDHTAKQHNSLKWFWWPAELWPKLYADAKKNYKKRPRLNLGRRRSMPENSVLHESVLKRIDELPRYRPANLPKTYTIEPAIPLR